MDILNSSVKGMTKDQSRDTGMAMVLLLLLTYFATKQHGLLTGAVGLHILNMTWPRAYAPVAVIWFALSSALGKVVSKILLSAVFFVVVTPIGVLRRLVGKDSLKLRVFKASRESAMVDRNHMFVKGDLEKPY